MKFENNARGRGYDVEVERHRHHHRNHRHHHRHRRNDQPPYFEQNGSSSGSIASPQPLPYNRPASVASVGAWIKAKSSDWFNPSDPFGAMTLYLQTMKYFREGHRHHRHRRHRHEPHRESHRRHHRHRHRTQEPVPAPPLERRRHHRHSHRRHHRDVEVEGEGYRYGHEDGRYNNRRQMVVEDVTDNGGDRYRNSDQPTYHSFHRSRRGSSFHDDTPPEDFEMGSSGSRPQSSVMSDMEPIPEKKKRIRLRNELQRRDRVVVVCFIAVNCFLAALGLGSAVLSGLAAWKPDAYRVFYSTEINRVFADMLNMKTECGSKFSRFVLTPNRILPGVFPAVCYASIALGVIGVYALLVPLIASLTPRLRRLHIALHIIYILAILAFAGVIAAYLCIYFQNTDSIEASMRVNAKTSYIAQYRGNPMQSCDPISNFVNFIQRYFRCCGVDDGHDFEDPDAVPYFKGSIVDDGKTYGEDDEKPVYRVPLTCCRLGRYYEAVNGTQSGSMSKSQFRNRKPRGWMIDLCRRVDSPLYGFSDRTSYMRIGCWPVVKEFFTQPVRVGLIVLGVFCLLLLYAATLSFLQTRLC